MPFPSAHDGDGDLTVARLGAYAPPQTFFVAADGGVVGRKVGEITSQEELDGLVEQYLGVRLCTPPGVGAAGRPARLAAAAADAARAAPPRGPQPVPAARGGWPGVRGADALRRRRGGRGGRPPTCC